MKIAPLLSVENLNIAFASDGKWNSVIHNISYSIQPNEIVGIVGQ